MSDSTMAVNDVVNTAVTVITGMVRSDVNSYSTTAWTCTFDAGINNK